MDPFLALRGNAEAGTPRADNKMRRQDGGPVLAMCVLGCQEGHGVDEEDKIPMLEQVNMP